MLLFLQFYEELTAVCYRVFINFQFTRGYNIPKSATFQLILNGEQSKEILFLSIYSY